MGSIVPLENRPKNKCRYWRLFISLGTDRRGKRIQKSKRFRGTYGEAKKALALFEAECKNIISEEIRLSVFMEKWYEKRIGRMRDSTLRKDRQAMKTLLWLFGDIRLSEFTPEVIDTCFRELMDKGGPAGRPVRPSYAGHLKSSLNSMLKYARKEGYLYVNPIEGTEYIKRKYREKDNVPTAAEVKSLLAGLDPRDGRQMCAYLCAALGLRRAEALGLQWKNTDLDEGVLHIRVALQNDGTLGQLKTDESRRTLPIPDYLREALEIRRDAAASDIKLAKNKGLIEEEPDWNELTVCCEERGRPVTASMASHWWEHHRSIFGIKCGLHGLRHALLTTLAQQDVHPKVMQSIAGHASPVTSLRVYAHTNMNDKEQAFGAIVDAVAPVGEEVADETD